jgi:4-diphosphocytidyl-2-C-methyl-D-erythritol kinase
MLSYSLFAPAKINLDLEIIGDRPDGYHELVMILQSVTLGDRLEIKPQKNPTIEIHCNHQEVPLNESNLAYRAAKLMQTQFPEHYGQYGGVEITIEKNIPVAAGLAGGSTDGAAVLVGINLMWELGLTQQELQSLAAQLGSDLPFCISGGTAIATGRGEELDPILDLDHLFVLLGKYENLGVSTPWAYQNYRQKFNHQYLSEKESVKKRIAQTYSSPLVKGIMEKNGEKIGQFLHNDLEKVVLPEYTQVAQLKNAMTKAGGLGTLMSGSGPTVFTLCESKQEAESIKQKVENQISDSNLRFWIAQLSSTGISLI